MLNNATIVLVRHAEKPGNPDEDSKSDGPDLSDQGKERAQAYVTYFQKYTAQHADGTRAEPLTFTHLFAAADNLGVSYRPRLTLEPLALTTRLPFSRCVRDNQYPALVSQLMTKTYDGANILICWHHGEIIALADALLAANGPAPILSPQSAWPPQKHGWPGEVFYWVLQIRYATDGTPQPEWTRCFNEHLFPTDTKEPPI